MISADLVLDDAFVRPARVINVDISKLSFLTAVS